jgi:simple sugar transport system ATP-binding protein
LWNVPAFHHDREHEREGHWQKRRPIAPPSHFGARALILDEPTAALGVTQSGIVLRYIAHAARGQGIGVIFITHNPHHAYMVGDHFMVLARGE